MNDILAWVLTAIAPLMTLLMAWLGKKLADLIQAKVNNTWLSGSLVRLDYAVVNAVKAVEQTLVYEIKAASVDGTITPEEAAKIKAAAIGVAKSYLGVKGLNELCKVLGLDSVDAIETLIGNRIEAAVLDLKAPAVAIAAAGVATSP